MEDMMLQDTWTYRFHDPDSNDWTLPSYVRLADVSSIQDMWEVHQGLQHRLPLGMFFVMREHVFPCWDDPANINGGCLSIKVLKNDLAQFWETLMIRLLGETLAVMDTKQTTRDLQINGISTSPKHQYCIVKIWLGDNQSCGCTDFHLPDKYHGNAIYKSNSSMMQNVKSGATNKV